MRAQICILYGNPLLRYTVLCSGHQPGEVCLVQRDRSAQEVRCLRTLHEGLFSFCLIPSPRERKRVLF